jgi:hypothetical protein
VSHLSVKHNEMKAEERGHSFCVSAHHTAFPESIPATQSSRTCARFLFSNPTRMSPVKEARTQAPGKQCTCARRNPAHTPSVCYGQRDCTALTPALHVWRKQFLWRLL